MNSNFVEYDSTAAEIDDFCADVANANVHVWHIAQYIKYKDIKVRYAIIGAGTNLKGGIHVRRKALEIF